MCSLHLADIIKVSSLDMGSQGKTHQMLSCWRQEGGEKNKQVEDICSLSDLELLGGGKRLPSSRATVAKLQHPLCNKLA